MTYGIFGSFLKPISGCGCAGTEDNCDPCTAKPIQSDHLTYNGPNLPCTGIHTCDTLTVSLQKIDQQICLLITALYNLTTTTTSTTSPPI